jgi:hypothetical protein
MIFLSIVTYFALFIFLLRTFFHWISSQNEESVYSEEAQPRNTINDYQVYLSKEDEHDLSDMCLVPFAEFAGEKKLW